MDALETATELTLALIDKNERYHWGNGTKEILPPDLVGQAFDTIFKQVCKTIDGVNKE